MKKLVFASAMALAAICLALAPHVPAQDAGQVSLPADQYNAYQNATTQTDPAAKAAALENFLQTYPQSPVKKSVLDQLISAYQQAGNSAKALDAANRLLQLDPNNLKAIFISVYIDAADCKKAVDPQTGELKDPQPCDDAAILAQKGLDATKPADMSDADWKNFTTAAYPTFHSTIALDDALSKKDYAGAIKEYTAELMLYPPDACAKPGPCLADTLQLAQAYAKPGPSRDEVKAVWFYARAWDFAPPNFRAQIEPQLDYWYKRFHGTLDGEAAITQQIGAIKTQAQSTLFPPSDFKIAPAPTPAELAHHAYTSGNPMLLSLEDKEYILANGSDDDANGLWALLKGQQTPVPGVIISAQASVYKITVTSFREAKPKDYVVALTTPTDCDKVPEVPDDLKVKDAQAYILANGVKADTDAMGDVLTEEPTHIHRIEIVPSVSVIKVAVAQDAKDNKTADFIVNMSDPVSCKDVPEVGSTLGLQPDSTELDATYTTFTKVPASNGRDASAQIELGGGFLQQAKKAPVHGKPSPAHRAGTAHHTGT